MLKVKNFILNKELFGCYCLIKQQCGEEHIYKVIGTYKSNTYKDIPASWHKEEYVHKEVVNVVNVIHCGIDETKTERYRLSDVKIIEKLKED